jgi:multidrug efflux pump subunit AcrA (membrane-fusion protein)
MLDTYIKAFKAHERLMFVLVAAGILWFGIGKIESIEAHHDNAALQTAQTVAAVQAQKDAALATQAASDKTAFDALQTKITAQNAALVQANVALATALTKQQKTDAGLPLSDLANRWLTLVPESKPTVTVDGGIFLSQGGAVATVQQLEEVPVQAQELVNDQILITNGNALTGAQTKQVADLNAQVTGLNSQIVDNGKVCDARLKIEQDKSRKNKRRWFLTGLVLGFLGRSIIK